MPRHYLEQSLIYFLFKSYLPNVLRYKSGVQMQRSSETTIRKWNIHIMSKMMSKIRMRKTSTTASLGHSYEFRKCFNFLSLACSCWKQRRKKFRFSEIVWLWMTKTCWDFYYLWNYSSYIKLFSFHFFSIFVFVFLA